MTPTETKVVKRAFTLVAIITAVTLVLWLMSILTINDAFKTLSIAFVLVGMIALGWKSLQ